MGRSVPTVPTEVPLVSWRCYEPAGHRVELSEIDLVQHVLLVGSTGSGKSTLLVDAIRQLMAHEAKSRGNRAGLLILDAKDDDLVSRVQEAAARAGRADDVMLFGPRGDHGLDLFGGLKSLDDVDRVTRQVLLGLDKFGGENAYWWQAATAMLHAAFALLVASKETISFTSTIEFLRQWFLSPDLPPSLIELVQGIRSQGVPPHPMLATALDQVALWKTLDPKTRTNLQSCLLLVLQPFLSPAAVHCFSPQSAKVSSPAQAATEGRVCVVTVNAMAEPDLARFYFRLAKQSFFDAVQQRKQPAGLCGLVADEFPLVVTREDVEQLATVRSKRCFVIAAIQACHSVSERLGIGQCQAVINHFNTVIYMRTREAETAVHAFLALGTRQERLPRPRKDVGWWILCQADSERAAVEVPVCPMGALGRLQPHQAYVAHADGRRTESPVWFVPWFEQPGIELA